MRGGVRAREMMELPPNTAEESISCGGDRSRLETVTTCRDYLFHEFSVMI